MENTVKKLLAMILSVVMLISAVPTQAFAYMMEKGEKLSIVGKDGKTVTEDESWEKTFPYGTFAFERGDIIVGEGGAEVTLKLYRMGGTTGRATALISYDPVIAKMADGTGAYANAAGSKDITITVEDPLPIAQYQALGKDPEPLQPETPVALEQGEYQGAESQPGDISLTPGIVADTYRWECLFGTEWEPVNGAVNREFVVSGADYPDFDYRCIYTVGEKTYCTNSAKGTVYVPAADEVLPAMPENMSLNPDPTYTTIQTDPNNDYLGYEFIMTFADGEFVKEIKLSSPDDNLAEAEKFGAFTIIDHEGGTLYDAANTVALHVVDNDAPEASQLGFAVTDIEADKASGDAVLTVRRTGGNQQVLTLEYETKDGTAVAGKDYMASKGSLIFYADADEQKITVPLVNDGIASEERSSFTVVLSNLKGDEGKLCTLTNTVATVSLWNSGKTEQVNLATLLQDDGAEDISGAITEGTGSVAPVGVQPITGKQVIEDVAEPMIGKIEKGDTSLLTYDYADPIKFVRATGDDLNKYWRDFYWFARAGDDYGYPWDVNNTGPDPFRSNWTGNGESAGRYHSHTLRSVLNEDNRLIVDDALFEEHFDRMQAVCQFTAEWVSGIDWDLRGGTYTYGNVGVISDPQDSYPRVVGEATCNPYIVKEGLKHNLKFTPQDYMNVSWSMQDDISNITLNTICDGEDRPSVVPAVSTLRSGILHRRSLDNDLKLRIVTANDANNRGEAEGLQEDFYSGIRPKVTVIPGEGGVTPSGKLYVGSKLKVDLTVIGGSYGIDNMATYAVCVTNKAGQVVARDQILSQDHKSATLTIGWDDIYLPDTYTINVILCRTQKFNLDIAPSVPRLENNQQAIDPSKIGAAWNAFWDSGEASQKGSITVGRARSALTPGADFRPDEVYNGIEEIALSRSDFIGGTNAIFNPQYQQFNIQWINFNRSADDVIVYNGRSFPGNEKIWLQQKDFALEQMQFFYYSKEYLSAESVMVTTLQKTGLYLDMNCNGIIDGKWNSTTGFFELDKTSPDEFVAFLQDGVDYDENLFAPIEVGKRSNGLPKYAQYFMKVTYTMNPRALQPVPGTDLTKRAQVLPALITKLTEPASYNKLTEQQKAYRYVVSGMNKVDDKAAVRSADNHVMFGAAATEAATIDIPLGGDTSPAKLNGDNKTFSWAPNYWGNLLYPFANPEPIVVPHSLAGDNIPIAEAKSVDRVSKEITYKQEDGARRLNGYLGSYTANDTFALCVREQEKTTDTIAAENHVTWNASAANDGELSLLENISPPPEKGHPTPESVTLGKTGTFANTEYLKASNSPDSNEENATMEGSENEYPEFDQDIGVKLPSSEVGVTDFVTIIMDEYEVGFAIGIPMGGYNSNGDGGAGGTGTGASSGTTTKDKWSGPKGACKSSGSDMKAMKDWMGAKKGDRMKAFTDSSDDYPASGGKAEPASSHAVEFALSFAFMFKYDKVENTYHFSQFKFTASASYTFSYQVRFTPAPILYFFVTVGGSIEIETGATIDRVIVEKGTPKISDTNPLRLPDNDSYKFQATKRVWNITFKGKLLVECFTDQACTVPYNENLSTKGYVTSDGMEPVTLNLLKQVAMDVPSTCWVKLTALTDTDVTRLVELAKMETKSYFSGLGISPSVFLEVGFGVGVEIVKVEIFVKVNIDFAMMLGKYNEDTEGYDPFSFDEFNFGLGLGLRIVALIFNYELDVIQYNLGYNKEDHIPPKSGWKHGWKALNGMFGGEAEISATDSQGNTFAVRIRMPGDASQTQNIYSNEKPKGDMDPFAYDPSGENVPFQLSGYGSSGDAFKFADGLITGYDYKVIAANGDNYLIYTISRPNSEHAVNNSMLVMSKIKLTSTNGQDSYGLVNPIDGNTTNPYIMLDTVGGADDGTGDLEFKAWTDATNKIHATWVSYATKEVPATAKPVAPDAATYIKPLLPDGTTPMDATNYESAVAPVALTPVAEPKPPLEKDYFLTEDAYNLLGDEAKKAYAAATDNTESSKFYVATPAYETKAAADAALLAANNAYTPLKAAYDQYVSDQAAYVTKNAAFTAWKDYFTTLATREGEIQAIAAAAAKNTVVKTASFDATQSATGFTEAKVVSGSTGNHVFLPIPADEKVTIYAKANHYESAEKTTAKTDFTDYLSAKVYNLTKPPVTPADFSKSSTAQFRLMTEEGLWDAYGKGSSLCVAVDGAAAVVEVSVTPGQTIDNIEAAKIGGTYYVAYTTSQKQYTDASGNSVATGAAAADYVNIRRLLLRTFTVDGTSGAVTWTNADSASNKALLLRTIYDYDIGGTGRQDGVYNGSTYASGYKDPTFSNLQFLNAQLGALKGTNEDFETMSAVPPEDFLLFDMNGTTYVIPQTDLQSIATSKNGKIIPFFAPGAKSSTTNSAEKGASTGRGETTIGADGAGNLSAVYVGTVPYTLNNALYLSKYDPISTTWGAGTMLAMNYMQVHEDGIKNGWTGEETEKAFLGKKEGYKVGEKDGGGLNQFKFTNLQIALGQKKTTKDVSGSALSLATDASGEISVPAPEITDLSLAEAASDVTTLTAAGTGTKDTLLVLTQGSMTYLTAKDVDVPDVGTATKTQTVVTPVDEKTARTMYDAAPTAPAYVNRVPGVGVYAVSYGVGGQAIGESNVVFMDYDFSQGSKLKVSLGFKNTGDVGIRASAANPALVKLKLKTGGVTTDLATWEIKANILAGQKVELSGVCKELTKTLPKGSIFYIEVCEDATYTAGGGFKASTLLDKDGNEVGNLKVGEKADLSFSSADSSIKPIGTDANGDTILQVDLLAQNRGNAGAGGVFAQFSYETNVDADSDGKMDYAPINLTGHHLVTARQEELKPFGGITEEGAANLANGIYYLTSKPSTPPGLGETGSILDGNGIMANYGRKVTGTFTVPSSYYQGSLTGSLNLRVELFSVADDTTGWSSGIVIANHDEYNSDNNFLSMQIEHDTFYQSASKVTIPMGTTMRLPLQLSTTKGVAPDITVHEVPANGEEAHIGVSYYTSHGDFTAGRESGTLILAPSSEGKGVIHLEDVNTNSIYAVAYTVTAAGDGLNIYNDTDMFAFKQTNGDPITPESKDWKFESGVPSWGAAVEGKVNAPYLSNLAKGKVGASFTYRTQAQSIKLYFDGTVEISSTFPGYTKKTVSATGGETFVEVKFGDNGSHLAHDVTIKVVSASRPNVAFADFDRIVETFGVGDPPAPSGDKNSPHLFWSRSFPETATLTAGPVELTGYILDDGTLASVTLNGSEAPNITKNAEGFWQFTTNITANGVLNLSAIDTSGNRTTRNTRIDWFNTSASAGSKDAPTLVAKLVKTNGEELVGYLGKNESAFISATSNATGTPKVSASYYGKNAKGGLEKTPLAAGDDGRFTVANNGFYVVTAQNTKAQEWSTRVLYMDKKDQSAPMVTLKKSDTVQQSEGGLALVWSAQKADKKATATIASANINGNVLPVAPGKTWVGGSFPVTHAGEYTLTATDTAGNSTSASITLANIPVKNPGGTLATVTNAWNGDGSVTVDLTNIVGGKYDDGKSNKVTNTYKGSYEWNLSGQSDWQTDATGTVSSLAPGSYTLSVRDANDRTNETTRLTEVLTVGDEAVALTLTKATVGGGVGGGSALHTLDWTARKGVGASENITEITMNGKDIAITQGKELSGSLPLEYGGDYELIATSDGRSFTKTETVAGIPLTTPSKDALLTIEKPWNTALNNGKLTINLTTGATQKNLTGGKYDPAVLSAQNAYVGSYEWRLEPAVSHANSAAEAAWLAEQVAKPEGWATAALSGLSVGNYILIIQDAQDRGNAATALTIPVAITSELVTFKATPKLASKSSAADGAIDVEAFGGYHSQNVYQFAARPMKDENSMGTIETVTAPLGIEYPEKDGWKQPAWQLGDLAKSAPNQSALSGLRVGWYQVAVRTMLGVTAADMTELMNLYKTYTDAITAKAEESVIEAARLAYEAKKTAMENASNSGYTTTPGLWANAATIAVYVPATAEPGTPPSGQIKPSDIDYKTEGVVKVMLSAKKPVLSPRVEEQLIADNKNKELVIGSPMMEVRIPAGTLAEGDDLNAMLMPTVALPQDASGYVVQYTDKDGVTHLLPLSRVTSEKVTYMASEPGSYSLVQNTKRFDDIPADFWGEDEIYFVTQRGLFQGAGKDRFGHTETMTRGMFVTVLGRLAGANPAEYGETPFTDVTADSWYGGYAAWASKNNIVGGIGEKLFDPGAPVSREQMCVMLVRYLEWAKIILPVAESEQNFADQSEISTWAEQAIRQLVAAGIIKGTESGALRPGAEASRAEVATIYARLIEAILGA